MRTMKRFQHGVLLIALSVLPLVAALPGHAAVFIKFDGIDGESVDEVHKGAVDVQAFSWGVSNAGSVSGGGGGAGKAAFQDLSFSKLLDKTSPVLALSCASGAHIKTATLYVRKAGEAPKDYHIITLHDVLVSSVSQSGGSDGSVYETVSLSYGKIEWEYVPANPDGSQGTPVKAGWDVVANTRL